MNNMSYDEQALRLAGTTSLASIKSLVSRIKSQTSAHSYLVVEVSLRLEWDDMPSDSTECTFAAILGGSEEVIDLAMRMAIKQFPSEARL